MLADALMRTLQRTLSTAETAPSVALTVCAFGLVAALPFVAVVPMTLVCLAVAARLPPWPAALAILAGATVNAAVAWTLAHGVFGARIQVWVKKRGGWLEAVGEGARREPLQWAVLSRYVPAPFVAAPMVLSAAGVGLGTTLLGTVLGMAPWTAVYVYAAHAGRQAGVRGFGQAALALVLGYVALRLLRRRLARVSRATDALKPRTANLPLVRLYTVPGQDLSDEARLELRRLRDPLGFEVDEILLSPGAAYYDYAPVAFLGDERLFHYQMDENVLRARLKRPGRSSESV